MSPEDSPAAVGGRGPLKAPLGFGWDGLGGWHLQAGLGHASQAPNLPPDGKPRTPPAGEGFLACGRGGQADSRGGVKSFAHLGNEGDKESLGGEGGEGVGTGRRDQRTQMLRKRVEDLG